ncbi:hypothetical protein LJC00_03245 [Dysgonomonas sp. OttesenSCG-928-M03]|nr:hypothetical protein [Dysgonomonas sp. OttesenSCG-928-M03]
MELIELENIWKEYDRKIADNTRLNKEMLKRMLTVRPERRLNWMKIKSTINLFSPLILLIITLLMNIRFSFPVVNFFIGLGLFIPVYTLSYFWDIKYYLKVKEINFTDATLTTKRKIIELEKYKVRLTRIRTMLMPLAISGALLMLFNISFLNRQFIIFLVLTTLVYIASSYYRFKSVYEWFKILNKEIEEIENLEKE